MSQDKKRDTIIDAAQKRFLHFGVGKTTMNEIADDLSISKASLYYYFPDKLNLYAAVLQKIINLSDKEEAVFLKEADPLKSLLTFLEIRTEFIIKNYNILEYLKTIGSSFPAELRPIFTAAKDREIQIITTILTRGQESVTLKVAGPTKTAELLLDCLEGLRFTIITNKQNFFPDKSQFYDLLQREKELATIFIKGLTC